jgi:hypothetical protein
MLAALAAMADARSAETTYFYTNFARFYAHRTEPIVVRLLRDANLREAIFPLDDDALAASLRVIDRMASREGFRYAGWDGFQDNRVVRFLEDHPPLNSETTQHGN